MRNFYQGRAFTLTELLVVLAVLAVVLFLLLPSGPRSVNKSKRIQCVVSLRNTGLGFRDFAADRDDKFPMQVSTNDGGVKEWMGWGTNTYRVFQSLSNKIATPTILICPTDTRKPVSDWKVLQNKNISYFVGVDAAEDYPERILAGDRNLQTIVNKDQDRFLSLATNDVVTWSPAMHERAGIMVLVDGSVQQLNDSLLWEQIRATGLATNRFMLPD